MSDSTKIMCTDKDKGCEWQNEVNDIINHLGNSDVCECEEVTCSNDCGKCLQRQYLTSHVEDECACHKVDCEYCHIHNRRTSVFEGEHNQVPHSLPQQV